MRWFEYDRRIFKQRGEYLNIGLRVDGKSESIIVASVFEQNYIDIDIDLVESTRELLIIAEGKYEIGRSSELVS